jgi:hypothetical protein
MHRHLTFTLLLSFTAWAQEPQMLPVAPDHLKDGRFPPEPLDAKKAAGWFQLLVPHGDPPHFFKSSNPLRPSYWSPIKGPDYRGTLVLTTTPQALYCWEEVGQDQTPREFPRWLSSFQPTGQLQSFEDLQASLSGQLELRDGLLRVEAGQFRVPPDTKWMQAKMAAQDIEFYQGSRRRDGKLDTFGLFVSPQSQHLDPDHIDDLVTGVARTMGQPKGPVQIDDSQPDHLSATFQVGDLTGYAQTRLTPAGVVGTLGIGPTVRREEVAELSESFRPSQEKVQKSKESSRDDARARLFHLVGMLVGGLAGWALVKHFRRPGQEH